MGGFLRQCRLPDDARRANLRAGRGSGIAMLRRASARWAGLSLLCGTAARAAAARVAGARAQPLAGAAYSPPSRAVPVGLQPLQGTGGGADPAGSGRRGDPFYTTCPATNLTPRIIHHDTILPLRPRF